MTYSLFKKDNPAFLIICPLLSIVLAIPTFLVEAEITNNTLGLSLLPYSLNTYWSTIIFLAVGNLLALTHHFILARNEVFRPMSFGPWVFLFVGLLLSPAELGNLPLLLGMFFALLAFAQIIDLYGQKGTQPNLFNASLFIGVAAILFLPFLLLIAVVWLCAFNCRALNGRGVLLSLYGIVCPWVIFLTLCYFFNLQLPSLEIIPSFSLPTFHYKTPYSIIIAINVFLILCGAWYINSKLNHQTLKEKSILQNTLIFVFALTAIGLMLFCSEDHRMYSHLVLAIPMSLCATFIVYHSKAKWFTDTILVLIFIGYTYNYYLLLKP